VLRPPVKVLRDLNSLPSAFRGGAVAIGNFDGVHRGHARIAERVVAAARRIGGAAVVFTFEPHPARLLRPDQPPAPLCWNERKAELLGELGVDAVLAYPTTVEFLQLEAREFFDQIVRDRLNARGLVEGRNFFFGHNRSGTVETLREFCAEAGIPMEVVDPVMVDGQPVSSSRVRAAISAGRVDAARAMLTRAYRIRGLVVHGRGRGRQIGYPTANLEQVDTLLPGQGIYAGLAWVGQSAHAAAISIGPNPTFNEGALKVEAYLIDYQDDLYGQTLEVDFLALLRDIKRFASAEELVAQMARDVDAARQTASLNPIPNPQSPIPAP
jgi:riboflavin kinase / FMN adenylyltransferase